MNRYVLLQVGFENPTPEMMEAWGKWFESIGGRNADSVGFGAAREVTHSGTTELEWGPDSYTGYSVIDAESIDDAEAVARACPFIKGVRIYEVKGHKH